MWKWLRRQPSGAANPPSAPPQAELDLRDPAVIADFPSQSAVLRQASPLCPIKGGGYLLLTRPEVHQAFTSPKLRNAPSRFSALRPEKAAEHVAASVAANIPPFLDPPHHGQVRAWLMRGFYQRQKTTQPDLQSMADKSLLRTIGPAEGVQPTGALLIEEVARDFVCHFMAHVIGIEPNIAQIKQATGAMFRLFAPASTAEAFASTNASLAAARAFLATALAQVRSQQTPSLLLTLDQLERGAAPEGDTLILDNALLILADGIENVEVAIGQVMLAWADDPQPIDATFVRRVIHQNTPGQTIARIAAQDFSLAGTTIREGTPVFLSLASANADQTGKIEEGKSQESDAGANARAEQTDYSFGMGRHRCVGESLAIDMIVTFCQSLAAREVRFDASDQTIEPAFGHRWLRGIRLSSAIERVARD